MLDLIRHLLHRLAHAAAINRGRWVSDLCDGWTGTVWQPLEYFECSTCREIEGWRDPENTEGA